MKSKRKPTKTLVASLVAGSLAAPLLADSLKSKSNGEFATVSGVVTKVAEDAVVIRSDSESIIVEIDGYGSSQDGYKLVAGDEVVASGRVDHDYLEEKKLEAGSVYKKNLEKMVYSNSDDEETQYPISSAAYAKEMPQKPTYNIRGKVVATSGREFIVDTGLRKLTVETEELLYNPMDDVGYTQVDVGDDVIVSGEIESKFFEGLELVARTISEV